MGDCISFGTTFNLSYVLLYVLCFFLLFNFSNIFRQYSQKWWIGYSNLIFGGAVTNLSNSNLVMEIFDNLQAATCHLIKLSDSGDGSIYCGKWREIMHYMSCGEKVAWNERHKTRSFHQAISIGLLYLKRRCFYRQKRSTLKGYEILGFFQSSIFCLNFSLY